MKIRFHILAILIACLFIFSSCVPENKVTETVNSELIFTQTPQATVTNSPLPTETPTSTGTPTPTATPTAWTTSIIVLGDQCWMDTEVEINSGDQVFLSATGFINTWGGKVGSNSDPDGQYKKTCGDVKCPLQGADYGALIGRIGDEESFLVGSRTNFSAQADGNLYLTVNDWECADNSGEFTVVVSYGKELAATLTPTSLGVWNLALNQPVNASRGEAERPPKYAVDGNLSTDWGSGGSAPQWIEIDLGVPSRVEEVNLLVTQSPYGDTVHRILFRTVDGEFVEVHRFEQSTGTGDWLRFSLDEPLEDIQFVRIETVKSPSWVGWIEIEVIGAR